MPLSRLLKAANILKIKGLWEQGTKRVFHDDEEDNESDEEEEEEAESPLAADARLREKE